MNHKEFLSEVQKTCHADYPQCTMMLSALLKLMVRAAIDQIPVMMPGLGTFTSHKHPEYIQENQQTGEQTLFPPRISYRLQPLSDADTNRSTNNSIADELAEFSHLPKELTETFIAAFVSVVNSRLKQNEEVSIHGLGTFRIIEAHQIGLQRVAFNPDDQMRQQVNAPFSCFEPVIIKEGQEPLSAEPQIPLEEEDSLADSAETNDPETVVTDVKECATAEDVRDTHAAEPEDNDVSVEEVTDAQADVEAVAPVEEAISDSIEENPKAVVEEDDNTPPEEVVNVPTEETENASIENAGSSVVEATIEENTEADVAEDSSESESENVMIPKVENSVEAVIEKESARISPSTEEQQEEQSNTLLYSSLGVIAAACIGFLVYIFGGFKSGESKVAEVVKTETINKVESAEPKGLPVDTLIEDSLAMVAAKKADSIVSTLGEEQTMAVVDGAKTEVGSVVKTPDNETATAETSQTTNAPTQTTKSTEEVKPKASEPVKEQETIKQAQPKEYHRMLGADGNPVMVTLLPGERLTIVALEQFGDKAFWPYIFDANADRLKAPNLVQAGMKLYLPDPAYYGIDASSEESLRKAKNRGAQLLK